jgi:hypothetical protein
MTDENRALLSPEELTRLSEAFQELAEWSLEEAQAKQLRDPADIASHMMKKAKASKDPTAFALAVRLFQKVKDLQDRADLSD